MRDYTIKNPRFSDTIKITEVTDPGNAQLINAATIQLLQNTLVNQEMIRKLEEKTGAATEFESEGVYKSGDYCLHNGILYKCVQDTEGEWNAESWKSTNTLEEIGAVQKKLDEVFQSSNENKQKLVSNLIAMGMQADTSETLDGLIDKVLEMTNTSEDTVTEAVMLEGYTAHDATGEQVTGIIPELAAVTVDATNVTQDDTYTYFEMPAGHYDENSKVRSQNSNLELKKYEISRLNFNTLNGHSSCYNYFTLSCEGYTKISFSAHTYANGGGYVELCGSQFFDDSKNYGFYGNPCAGEEVVIASKITTGEYYEYDITGFKYIYFNGHNSGDSYSGMELRHIVLS